MEKMGLKYVEKKMKYVKRHISTSKYVKIYCWKLKDVEKQFEILNNELEILRVKILDIV